MRNVIKAAIVALALAFAAPVVAQDIDAGLEAYKRGDYAAALREFRPLAEQGDAEAQHHLGAMYRDGQGVRRDYTEAAKWLRRAADQGLVYAQVILGLMYDFGKGVPEDIVKAHMWWSLAASRGHESATVARDILADRMTSAQLAEAQKLAREWKPK